MSLLNEGWEAIVPLSLQCILQRGVKLNLWSERGKCDSMRAGAVPVHAHSNSGRCFVLSWVPVSAKTTKTFHVSLLLKRLPNKHDLYDRCPCRRSVNKPFWIICRSKCKRMLNVGKTSLSPKSSYGLGGLQASGLTPLQPYLTVFLLSGQPAQSVQSC